MEVQKDILASDLRVDEEVRTYIYQVSVLAKYLAALGMLFVLVSASKTIYDAIQLYNMYERYGGNGGAIGTNLIIGTLGGILLGSAVYFAVSLFTYRFAVKLQQALALSDQSLFSKAWHHFKMSYRIMGIMFIVYIALIFVVVIS